MTQEATKQHSQTRRPLQTTNENNREIQNIEFGDGIQSKHTPQERTQNTSVNRVNIFKPNPGHHKANSLQINGTINPGAKGLMDEQVAGTFAQHANKGSKKEIKVKHIVSITQTH